jgi:mannose-6-phosphate isomerase-like protein (cupin superfamily)
MVEEIVDNGELLAIIVRNDFDKQGISFFTRDEQSQQLGFMRHPTGTIIRPHIHNPVSREIQYTQEVLFIKSGKLRVDFYNTEQQYLYSRILGAGDVVLLATGGHGFEVLEEIRMIEVKQGPYAGEADKTRFDSNPGPSLKII